MKVNSGLILIIALTAGCSSSQSNTSMPADSLSSVVIAKPESTADQRAGTTGSGQAQSNTIEAGAIETLRQFYTAYITEGTAEETNEDKVASIKKKYCTAGLLNKIEKMFQDEALDNDPFINAQDFDSNWLKTLSVEKDPQKENGYMVSYISEYDKRKVTIKLSVVKEGENYKIDNIPGL